MTPCSVSGNLQNLTSASAAGITITFELMGLGGNLPIVTGTSIIAPSRVFATTDSNGAFSVNLWGNDNITPGGTYYSVTFGASPTGYWELTGATANLNTQNQVVIPIPASLPSLDSTYLRLDGTNHPTASITPAVDGIDLGVSGKAWNLEADTISAKTAALVTPLAVTSGGTGTATPGLIAGANITLSGAWPNETISSSGGGGGGGTVTSVGLALPSEFTVSGSPVTSTGVLTAVLASQSANEFLASPNGSSGTPAFRALAAADVPTLNQNTTGTAANVTGVVSVAHGGTGTATPALVAGTAIGVSGSFPDQTINNTSAYASLADPLPVAHGGTGTATPALVAGTGISLTGSFPNQTVTNAALPPSLPLSIANGGTATATPSLVAGTGITVSGSFPDQTITNSAPAPALPLSVANGGTGTATPAIAFDNGNTIDLSGSATITSAPPTGSSNAGWKATFYGNTNAIGIAASTCALLPGPWFSVFAAAPANNGTTTTPDTHAKVSLGNDGTVRASGSIVVGSQVFGQSVYELDPGTVQITGVNGQMVLDDRVNGNPSSLVFYATANKLRIYSTLGAEDIFSIDKSGNAIFKGTVTPSGTP